jgi:hypothetical protein
MLHRDNGRRISSRTNAQEIVAAVNGIFAEGDWSGILFRKDCGWTARGLVTAALVWAWSSQATLKGRFRQALQIAGGVGSGGAPVEISYQAFVKLLVRWTAPLRDRLVATLQSLMERAFPKQFRWADYIVLAADGTKMKLARTRSNENRYSPKTRGRKGKRRRKAARARHRPRSDQARRQQANDKKADSPQISLTLLYHTGLRLPWDWRLGSAGGDRERLRSMIPHLPADALVVGDSGFFGYEFWADLLASRQKFVFRVGGNLRLLKKLGVVRESYGTIYVWPDSAAKRGQAPLVLRLIVVHDGRQPWYLVTSVLDSQRLSDRQVAEIYRRRWRIEVFFRHFKQTFGRAKLRSHKAEHVECEAQWSLLGLWTMLFHAQKEQQEEDDTSRHLSVARLLDAFSQAIEESRTRPEAKKSLSSQIRTALLDSYRRRHKHSRNHPRKKYKSPQKPPKITTATQRQRQLAKQILAPLINKGLTA